MQLYPVQQDGRALGVLPSVSSVRPRPHRRVQPRRQGRANAKVHFCSNCGSTTHFVLTQNAITKFGNALVGVNMWLADKDDIAGVELRFPDGRQWPGQGDFAYVREARIIGKPEI